MGLKTKAAITDVLLHRKREKKRKKWSNAFATDAVQAILYKAKHVYTFARAVDVYASIW